MPNTTALPFYKQLCKTVPVLISDEIMAKMKVMVTLILAEYFELECFYCQDNSPSVLQLQIDLVPTLSYLIGIPIPFSSIGSTITQLISQNDGEIFFKAIAA